VFIIQMMIYKNRANIRIISDLQEIV